MRPHQPLLIFVFVSLLFIPLLSAHKVELPSSMVHQYITKEALEVNPLIPFEIKNHTGNSITTNVNDEVYDSGDDVVDGSGEEDTTGTLPYRQHYFEPDTPNGGKYDDGIYAFDSSYQRASGYWKSKVIDNYIKGDIDESYYWLGRIIHLLEDATVPAHVHLDDHAKYYGTGDDVLEEFMILSNYWSQDDYNYKYFDGSDYNGSQYNYENLVSSFDRTDWEEINPRIKEPTYPMELFELFWYTAQKTQYYASDDAENNTFYRKSGSSTQYSLPNLWADEGITTFVTESQISSEDDDNEGPYVAQIANATIPHAMKAVAGLYRLFDDAVRIDWPTENHDYRRTGFTLLKGDMKTASQVEKTAFVLGTDITQEQVLKPIVADIDGNGYMETVNFVHDTSKADRTDIYLVEIKNKKTVKKWKVTALGGAIYFPGTLADLDVLNLGGDLL